MGRKAEREAINRNAAAQERIAGTQERLGDEFLTMGREDRDFQRELYDRISPFAENLIGVFDPERDYGIDFPDIQRPDFTAQIRRDYHDDLDSIQQGYGQNVANAEETLTASGLARSGIATGGLGAITRGAETDRSSARRFMQQRMEDESRAGYEDSRDLALQRYSGERGAASERANIGVAGANILAGQQGTFSPQPWYSGAGGSLNSATGSLGAASSGRYMGAQLPGTWSTIGGMVGGGLNAASNLASGGGLSSVWRGRG